MKWKHKCLACVNVKADGKWKGIWLCSKHINRARKKKKHLSGFFTEVAVHSLVCPEKINGKGSLTIYTDKWVQFK